MKNKYGGIRRVLANLHTPSLLNKERNETYIHTIHTQMVTAKPSSCGTARQVQSTAIRKERKNPAFFSFFLGGGIQERKRSIAAQCQCSHAKAMTM